MIFEYINTSGSQEMLRVYKFEIGSIYGYGRKVTAPPLEYL